MPPITRTQKQKAKGKQPAAHANSVESILSKPKGQQNALEPPSEQTTEKNACPAPTGDKLKNFHPPTTNDDDDDDDNINQNDDNELEDEATREEATENVRLTLESMRDAYLKGKGTRLTLS